jgi:hypothetical protein
MGITNKLSLLCMVGLSYMEKFTKQTHGLKIWDKTTELEILDMCAFNLKWYDYLLVIGGSIILVFPFALLLTLILQ